MNCIGYLLLNGRTLVVGELGGMVIVVCFQILSYQVSERGGENYGSSDY